jgi:hypothetical protein
MGDFGNSKWKSLVESGQPFVDGGFNYGNEAIVWRDQNPKSKLVDLASKAKWVRARNRIPKATLFGTEVSIKDVIQGAVSDGYFLSGVSALAEWPYRTKSIFLTQNYTKSGLVEMKTYIRGIETAMSIDDYLAFNGSSKTPMFCHESNQSSLWPAFLEKAFAKAMGTYDMIGLEGNTNEAFDFLTGAPTFYKETKMKTNDQWFDILRKED